MKTIFMFIVAIGIICPNLQARPQRLFGFNLGGRRNGNSNGGTFEINFRSGGGDSQPSNQDEITYSVKPGAQADMKTILDLLSQLPPQATYAQVLNAVCPAAGITVDFGNNSVINSPANIDLLRQNLNTVNAPEFPSRLLLNIITATAAGRSISNTIHLEPQDIQVITQKLSAIDKPVPLRQMINLVESNTGVRIPITAGMSAKIDQPVNPETFISQMKSSGGRFSLGSFFGDSTPSNANVNLRLGAAPPPSANVNLRLGAATPPNSNVNLRVGGGSGSININGIIGALEKLLASGANITIGTLVNLLKGFGVVLNLPLGIMSNLSIGIKPLIDFIGSLGSNFSIFRLGNFILKNVIRLPSLLLGGSLRGGLGGNIPSINVKGPSINVQSIVGSLEKLLTQGTDITLDALIKLVNGMGIHFNLPAAMRGMLNMKLGLKPLIGFFGSLGSSHCPIHQMLGFAMKSLGGGLGLGGMGGLGGLGAGLHGGLSGRGTEKISIRQ